MRRDQSNDERHKEIPGEIVRRNVKQVIDILSIKGIDQLQLLVNQYLNGEKSQYEFLLPKSKYHNYYNQQLNKADIERKRERKYNSFQKMHDNEPQNNDPVSQNQQVQHKNNQPQTILVVGTVEQVSVGAMCELIKQLRQNQEPYQPFPNEIYEQELTFNLNDPELDRKILPILSIIQSISNPQKLAQIGQKSATNKIDMLRNQFGTKEDGSMGTWGGKKYEGLGMKDEFSNYRKQFSKNFYQSMPR